MRRVPIRDTSASAAIKPRVFDYIRDDDGQEKLEIKFKGAKRTILLSDVISQIQAARNMQ